MNYFRELIVWQKAMDLVGETYKISHSFPREEVYGLTSQICRSAVSIPSNIAEGCGRKSEKDFFNFLGIALGSSFEYETQLIICRNLGFVEVINFGQLEGEIHHIQNMIIKLQSTFSI